MSIVELTIVFVNPVDKMCVCVPLLFQALFRLGTYMNVVTKYFLDRGESHTERRDGSQVSEEYLEVSASVIDHISCLTYSPPLLVGGG